MGIQLLIGREWHHQLRRDCHCGFDLLEPVIEIHVVNRILRRMVIRVELAFFIILDLQPSGQTLLTEGGFVPSVTACDEHRLQVEPVSKDCFAHHLR